MKRSSSAPCLADEENIEAKKIREDPAEPTSREYLQLALARVLELQRQVRDETYMTDATSDLGESDSEEDAMKEVVVKVFKDLPGSSPAIASIINKAMRPQPPQLRVINDKRVQLAGYDTCRRVALDFMNTVVKSTPSSVSNSNKNPIETEKEQVKLSERNKKIFPINESRKIFRAGSHAQLGMYQYLNNISQSSRDQANIGDQNNSDRLKLSTRRGSGNVQFRNECSPSASRDYEVRVRMLRGLDLHLATKQRDFTARLMRQ